ncbi:MAG: glycosyltransferase [Anaerolineales bacterium]|nr:glycosyltransferase [Anaerolineales bacterium]
MSITVVVPVYNGEDTIVDCMNALTKQSLPPDEVIVVDDGSTDRSAALAEAKSVRVIHQENQGPASARNTGIHHANGDLILFTDSDCEAHPDWVREMVNSLTDPEVAGVKGAYATRQKGIVAQLVQCEFEERYDLMQKFPQIDFIDTYSAGFRSGVLKEMGGFNTGLIKNEDVDLSYRLAKAGKKLLFNRQAIVYHRHPDSWLAYFLSKAKKGYWRTIVYRLHPGKAVQDTYTPQLLKIQILLALMALLLLIPAWFWHICLWIAIALWAGLLFSAFPFMLRVRQKFPRLIVYAILFIVVRSYAFVCGVVLGILGAIFFKPRMHPSVT